MTHTKRPIASLLSCAACAALLFRQGAHAQPATHVEATAAETAPVSSWFEVRGALARSNLNDVHSSDPVSQLGVEAEVGAKGSLPLEADRIRFVYDAAVFGRFADSFRTRDAAGNEEEASPPVTERRNANLRLRDFFVSTPEGAAVATVGKRRLHGGPGYALNPSNPLAPERDPVDPRSDRGGRWLASFERTAPDGELGFFVAPGVRENPRGYPEAVFRYRRQPWEDRTAHAVAMAWGTLAVGDTEIGGTLSALHRNDGPTPLRAGVGASLRREVDNSLSFHGEIFARQGSERTVANAECARTEALLASCFLRGEDVLSSPRRGDRAWEARFLIGGRRSFDDGSYVVAEWYHDSAGESHEEFERLIAVNAYLRSIDRRNVPLARRASYAEAKQKVGAELGNGRDFALRAQNYLLASLEDMPLMDATRVAAGASTVLSLRDNSGVFGPRVAWKPEGWRVEARGLFPYVLGQKKGARNPSGGRVSEADAQVWSYRVELALRHSL